MANIALPWRPWRLHIFAFRTPLHLQGARIRTKASSCGLLINVMKASEHRNRHDLLSFSVSMRRACFRCAGRPLSQRSMRAPVVEIADIFGQDLLQMALIEDEHVVQALGSDGSHPALGYGIGSRRSEWRANLGNTNIAHPTMECGAVTAVAVMNEKSWRLAIPSAAFDHLLSRPRGGGIRRHVHVQNLPAGVIDHEEHVQRSERDRSDAEEVARPDLRGVLPQE